METNKILLKYFLIACEKNILILGKHIFSLNPPLIMNALKINPDEKNIYIATLCKLGHIDFLNEIIYHYSDAKHTMACLEYVCAYTLNNRALMSKYLCKLMIDGANTSTNADLNRLFVCACKSGFIEAALVLYSFGSVDTNKGFYQACINHRINIATWLRCIDNRFCFVVDLEKIIEFKIR